MARPCTCDRFVAGEAWVIGQCKLCWLYANDERYRNLWDSNQPVKPKATPFRGPGTVLTSYFQWFGLHDNGKCGCRKKARRMDCKGPEWCQANFDTIIGWLRESAEKLEVTFLELPARIALQWAIDQSKKEREVATSYRNESETTVQ